MSFVSGTQYLIYYGNDTISCCRDVTTKPISVKSLQISAVTSYSVSLTWSKPDEYQTSYSYRVQTNVTSSATMVNNTILTNESATIMNLTPGETYTFLVYTRAADNSTESDPVSNMTCTKPLSVKFLQIGAVTSYSVSLTWNNPYENQTSYGYRVQTNIASSATMINNIIVTNESVTIMNLTPGETYTFLVYTRAADNFTESDPISLATYIDWVESDRLGKDGRNLGDSCLKSRQEEVQPN
ncbi:receptor-type tyrosine-protein phosphatase eta-like isoform X2 [Ranitomeya variabilis]|uniref:receptor-type tyrosine-protein phosphatase eta-like isoform X2 n=1 Tax=Ranitomeya variabilis TaxID=490064 RepID=UPI004056BF41